MTPGVDSEREEPAGMPLAEARRAAESTERESLATGAADHQPPAERASLARRIYDASHLSGEFLLRSGAHSSEYFDKYRFESDPRLLHDVAQGLAEMLPDDVDTLAGLELGGVPLATAVSQISGLPALFVRKQAKTYGTCRLAEGGEVAGGRLAVLEDVVTSGGQVLSSCRQLRELGAEIAVVLCVIDRQAGGAESLASEGLRLRALFRMDELNEAAGPAPRG